MGVYGMSSDSRDCRQTFNPLAGKVERVNSTPDPTKFVIRKKDIINGYPILVVQYPDVLNYEGIKVLMYGKDFDLKLIKDRIDPHFFKEGDSPIARFAPTPAGIAMAHLLAKKLP
jgi:hypothetical protein